MITKGMLVSKDYNPPLAFKIASAQVSLQVLPTKCIVQFKSTDIFTVVKQHRKDSGFPLAPCCEYMSASVTPLSVSRPRKSTNRTQPPYSS